MTYKYPASSRKRSFGKDSEVRISAVNLEEEPDSTRVDLTGPFIIARVNNKQHSTATVANLLDR